MLGPTVRTIFFAPVTNLKIFDFHGSIRLEQFWRLPLTSMAITVPRFGYPTFNDATLEKISISFPNLEKLHLPLTHSVTTVGVAALAALKNLCELKLEPSSVVSCGSGIKRLAECNQLRRLILKNIILPKVALTEIISSCLGLQYLEVLNVVETTAPEPIIAILDQLTDGSRKKITIKFGDCEAKRIWQETLDLVSGLLVKAGGPEITLE